MKNLIVLIASIAILFSCSTKDEIEEVNEFDSSKYPQKWELVRMTGQFADSELTGANMPWQEFYLLESDSTFLRWRENDGKKSEEIGTFSFKESQFNELMMTLKYDRPNDLVGSCYGSKTKEVLWIKSNDKMQNTWNECDGPGLEYKRAE